MSPSPSFFGRLGLSPNALTVIGFLITCAGAALAAAGLWLLAGIVVFLGGAFDLFDGALARATGKTSKIGAFLDSIFDRWGESVVYIGIVIGCLNAGFVVGAELGRRRDVRGVPGQLHPGAGREPRPEHGQRHGRGRVLHRARSAWSSSAWAWSSPASLGGVQDRRDRPTSNGSARPSPWPSRHRHPRHDHRHPAHHPRHEAGRHNRRQVGEHTVPKNDSNGHTGTNGKSAATAGSQTKTRAGFGRNDGKIRVAIVGVGNCASSLVQGRYYYENAKKDDFVPGLMHVDLGGYHIRDIEFVAAFDIDKNKVGKDLSEAIYTKPNNTYVFKQVPHIGVKVERGMTHDGLGKYLSQIIEKAPGPTADVVGILKERQVDVVVSYLPVGSEEATKWYVEQALKAGVGFVNAIPVFIGREPYWQRRFAEEGLPVIGDDIKSQVGATITHRVLTRLFMDRGVRLDRTYQLNFGGNTDFLNMLERERLESKKISKTNAVTSMLDYELDPDDIHVGP